MIKHKHHIIPKHIGGTDDPSNLIELTIEEHANAHRLLYEKYGRIEDKFAWLGLSGQIGKDDILRELSKLQKGKKKPNGHGAKVSAFRKTFRYSEESKLKISLSKKGKKLSHEHKQKIANSLVGKVNTEYQKQRVAETRQKTYILKNPNGEVFEVTNLSKYCREHELDQGNISANRTKGWSCKKKA
jgi:hypothetical protein